MTLDVTYAEDYLYLYTYKMQHAIDNLDYVIDTCVPVCPRRKSTVNEPRARIRIVRFRFVALCCTNYYIGRVLTRLEPFRAQQRYIPPERTLNSRLNDFRSQNCVYYTRAGPDLLHVFEF